MHSWSILFLPYKTIRAYTSKTTADLRKYHETCVKPTCPVASSRPRAELVIESDNDPIKNISRPDIFITPFSCIVPRY